MTEREKRVEAADIGDKALDLDTGPEREAFIASQCATDPELETYVREYVANGEGPTTIFSTSESEEPFRRIHLGKQIGQWTLRRVLGEGGFGIVFLAERESPHQYAAIKLLQGAVHSRDTEARFRREQQALARMNHPFIVRLMDAGITTAGQAYVVMEYVEAPHPIDVYCQQKNLNIREKIQLFQKVCQAVSYAHREGIFHRDLKPGNILVAQDGTPKLVDFGLAKLLHQADDDMVHSVARMGTSYYISPEQACGSNVNATTDVYSLGIVLYELLAKTDPFDIANRKRELLEQVICEAAPETLDQAFRRSGIRSVPPYFGLGQSDFNRLQRDISGDLNLILQMAIRKEPDRRYGSVDRLYEDLEHFLNYEPVKAHPESVLYRAQRFSRKYRWLLSAALLFVTTLTISLGVIIHERNRAEDEALLALNEKLRANAEAEIARRERNRAGVEAARSEAEAKNARIALIRSLYATAIRFIDTEPNVGLAYFAEALRLARDADDKANVSISRNWIASMLMSPWTVPVSAIQNRERLNSVELSPDNTQIITGAQSSPGLKIWDVATGRLKPNHLRLNNLLYSASFTPDGKRILTRTSIGETQIWDYKTLSPVGPALLSATPFLSITSERFSSDGRFVIVAVNNWAQIYETATGRAVGNPLQNAAEITGVSFSSDGERVVTSFGSILAPGGAQVWDVTTGRPIGVILHPGATVNFAAFSSDRSRIVTASESGIVKLWDAETGVQLGSDMGRMGISQALSTEFSPNGNYIVALTSDGIGRVWDGRGAATMNFSFPHMTQVFHPVFSPDGSKVLTAPTSRTIQVLDAATGKQLGGVLQHQNDLSFANFSSDGRYILSTDIDGNTQLWGDYLSEPLIRTLKSQSVVDFVDFISEGDRVIAVSRDGTMQLLSTCDANPVAPTFQLPSKPGSVALGGGRILVTYEGQMFRVFDSTTGKAIGRPMRHSGLFGHNWPLSIEITPNGRRALTYIWDSAVIWNIELGRQLGSPLQLGLSTQYVPSAHFTPNGEFVLTSSADHIVKFWNSETGEPADWSIDLGAPFYFKKFSSDGQFLIATSSKGDEVAIWNVATKKPIGKRIYQKNLRDVNLSPDGLRIVTASENGIARVWDIESGSPLTPPLEHRDRVFTARFSADGYRIITASADNTAQVWDAATGQRVGSPFKHNGYVFAARFSSDGRRALTSSFDKTAKIWLVDVPLTDDELENLAEAVGGYKLDETGSLVVVPPQQRIQVLTKNKTSRDCPR